MLDKSLINSYFTQFCAGGVLVSVPISILFMIMQKFYVEGITGGAVKVDIMNMTTGRRGIVWKTPDITADELKMFACIVMLIQTVGIAVIEKGLIHLDQYTQESLNQAMSQDSRLMTLAGIGSIMQLIGGMAIPVFAFLLVEGFRNTSDYKKVDPFLGNNEDFKRLCQLAKERRIHVILDGVYSHTGDDSVYFNKKGNYEEPGAYQGEESKYYDWYDFNEDGTYKSWWGFETLPEVNELNEKFVDYIITGEDSVIKHWLKLGASGFRLDVADELPDEFIFKLRSELKKKFKNYTLIGEVWEDVTTKESYGTKRKYALGKGLDSAMNYPLKVNVTDYLLGNQSAKDMKTFLISQQCNYPKPLYYALMNLLSSHDIPRIRTTLATGMNENLPSREQQAEYVITSKMDQKGKALTRLAMAVQFFVPGMPCIYYGDEYGMHGLMDPFNRGAFLKMTKKPIRKF